MVAENVFNCAGLFAPEFRDQFGLDGIESYLVKGRYLKLNKKYFHDSLIYPIPPVGLKGLGVHTSFDFDGIVRFGPDTSDTSSIDYQVEEDALEQMFPAISNTFKGVSKED